MINSGEYTDPPPWPNIENTKAIKKAKKTAASSVELISIVVDTLQRACLGALFQMAAQRFTAHGLHLGPDHLFQKA